MGRVRESLEALRWGRRRAVLTVALATGLVCAAAPAASFGATVSITTDASTPTPKLHYIDTASQANSATFALANCAPVASICTGGTYTVTDSVPITVGTPLKCTGDGTTTVTCQAAGTNRLTVVAGFGDDSITMNADPPMGTAIYGGPGIDRLSGGPGGDFMDGGDGGDNMFGNAGNDVMDPGVGGNSDIISNDPGECDLHNDVPPCSITIPDKMDGGSGANTMNFKNPDRTTPVKVDEYTPNGEVAFDGGVNKGPLINFTKVVGTQFNDEIIGGPRDDILIGGGGADILCGGYGTDTVDYSDHTTGVNVSLDRNPAVADDPRWNSTDVAEWGKAPHDCRQTGPSGAPVVDATHPRNCVANDGGPSEGDCVGADVENVVGTSQDDILTGNSPGAFVHKAAFYEPRGRNVLDGGGGNDLLDGQLGADVLNGGSGNDTVTYATETADVRVSLDGAANDGSTADFNADGGFGDSVGSDVENIIGGSRNDVLAGSSVDNRIQGGPGTDLIKGFEGNDTLDGGDDGDTLEGGDGQDTLGGGGGDDTLKGGFAADTLGGGDGSDTVDYSDSTTSVTGTPDGVANDGRAGEGDNVAPDVEGYIGGSDNDVLIGNDGPGTINGGGGGDTIDGGGGNDMLIGGDGLDTVTYASHAAAVTADLQSGTGGSAGETDSIAADVENLTGGAGNDTLSGNDSVNILSGGPGDDTLNGRGGEDQLFGGDGKDTERGDAGNDTLSGEGGGDNLQGGADADTLFGGDANDLLDGGAGSDKLAGDAGDDAAIYSSRSKDVDVTLDGSNNDGEKGELDQIRLTTESTRTGGGNDSINVRDGIKGEVSCGKGNDSVVADAADTVASDCEQVDKVTASSRCSVRNRSVRMKGSRIKLRLTCPVAAKGTLTLQTAGAYKAAKKTRKKVRLGRKSFSLKAGKSKTLSIKLSKKARRLVKRNKRLRARAIVSVKRSKGVKASKSTKTLTIKASSKKGK